MWACVWWDVPSWWGRGSCRPSGTTRRERCPGLWHSELCYICGNLQETQRGRRDVGAGNELLMRVSGLTFPCCWIKAEVVAISSSSSYFCCEASEQDGGRHFTLTSRGKSGSLLLTLYYKYNYILKITIMSLRDPSVRREQIKNSLTKQRLFLLLDLVHTYEGKRTNWNTSW